MPDYKAMYFELFRASVQAVQLLQDAQAHAEQQLLAEDPPPLRLGEAPPPPPRHTIVLTVQMLIQEHNQRHGGTHRISGSVCQNLRHIEQLETTDQRSYKYIYKDRAQQRQCNLEEHLHGSRPVYLGSLKE